MKLKTDTQNLLLLQSERKKNKTHRFAFNAIVKRIKQFARRKENYLIKLKQLIR